MIVKETVENVKKEYPDLYKSIADKMKKKNIDEDKLEWYYSYCVMIDNSPNPTSYEEVLNNFKTKYGISLGASFERKKSSVLIAQSGETSKLPSVFKNMAKETWKNIQKEINREKNFISNLDSVLKSVGKKGSVKDNTPDFKFGNGLDFMNHLMNPLNVQQPVYPTLEDIKKVRPDIYNYYLSKSNGSTFVIYTPRHKQCDDWGFIVEPILLATRRNDEERFITKEYGFCYLIEGNTVNFGGFLSGTDKALAAKEGECFVGWKRTKQYRLTKSEIDKQVKSKIFYIR